MSLFDDLPEPTLKSDDLKKSDMSSEESSHEIITFDEIPFLYTVVARKGERPEMQDAHIVIENFKQLIQQGLSNEIARISYFAVFDGHGGSKASNFACKRLQYQLASRFPKSGIKQVEKDIKRVFYDAYKKTDEEFLKEACQQRPHWRDGSTAATVVLVNNTLYVANLGDSKVVLARSTESLGNLVKFFDLKTNKITDTELNTICLTRDHNPMDYEERQRIQASGGIVQNGRVNNILEVSRSFGDYQFKKQGVTCIPDVRKCQITKNDQFLLIACDGLWKSFPSDEAITLVHKLLIKEIQNEENLHQASENFQFQTGTKAPFSQRGLEAVCTHLVNEAVLRMSGDNVTCILIVFPNAFIEKNLSSKQTNKDISSNRNDHTNEDEAVKPSAPKIPRISEP